MPRLLRILKPLPAGLLLGAVWAIWHAPSFLISASNQAALGFIAFFVSLACQGVVLCWIYIRSGGNWLFAGIVPHAVINCAAGLGGFAIHGPMYWIVPLTFAGLVMLDPVMRRGATPCEASS